MLHRGELFYEQWITARGKVASNFLTNGNKILTHSKSRAVLHAIQEAVENHKIFHVFLTYWEPNNSGYNIIEMYENLTQSGVFCTLIPDSAMGCVMEQVDMKMVGAGVAESGNVINKVSSTRGNAILLKMNFNSTFDFLSNSENITSLNDTISCGADLPIVAVVNQVLYSIVCIVGLLGNTLVIYVVLRFSKMQTVTNMYIVNLAIADECFLIGIPFLVTTMSLRYWPFGKIMCKAYMTTTSINQFTSSIFLFIMSADRYIAVCHPISSPKMRTPFISKIVSLTAWATSALFMIPVFLYANAGEAESGMSCNIYWPDDHGGQTTFTLYSFVLGFAIPLILILIFYFLVIRKLQTVGPKNKSKEKKRSHRKVTKLVLTVITVYVLCWLPYWITQVALIYTPPKQCQSRIGITAFLLAGFLSYSNSAMNPILYAFLSDNFKKSFLKACTCATGKDINATLHIENSVFPKRNKANTERVQSHRMATSGTSRGDIEDEEGERGLLISKTSTTTVTMTSRSNITITNDIREQKEKEGMKNGNQGTLLTQV